MAQEPDRKAVLKSIADRVILPAVENMVTESEALEASMRAFEQSPSLAGLEDSRNALLQAIGAWKKMEAYNIGAVQAAFIKTRIETVPANTDFIDGFIDSDETLDEAFIDSKGSSAKGLRAIEYLLFDPNLPDEDVLASLTTDPLGPRRADYALASAENLTKKVMEIQNIWTGEANYYQEFIDNDGTGVSASMNMIVNEITALVEKMAQTKLGKPLGKATGGAMEPELLESYRSGNSAPDLLHNLESIKAVYHGGDEDDEQAMGLNDYLTELAIDPENPLTERISAQFETCENALSTLQSPLRITMLEDPQPADESYEALKDLLVLFQTDLVSQLSITLTFNDNDGD